MDGIGLECPGCGNKMVSFDPKTRTLICPCGLKTTYSRATMNKNGKVVYSKENAMRFFKEGKFDNANTYARDVLNISMDNAVALFIMSYYEEYVIRRNGAMDSFFTEIDKVALEYDEVQDLQDAIAVCAINLLDYEEQIIRMIAMNLQDPKDADDLCEFMDKVLPYFISKRPSTNFFTKNLIEMYTELAGHCGIPKTCFALLKSIETNPDSPYVGNEFYLKAKAKYFYDNFVCPLEGIIMAMNNQELRNKFMTSYLKKKQKFAQDAGF